MTDQSFPSHVGHRRCFSAAVAFTSMLPLLLLQTQIQSSDGFSSSRSAIISQRTLYSLYPLNSEVQTPHFAYSTADADDNDAANELPKLAGSLSSCKLREFELKDHKPLGCSVEESLANEEDGAKYVFVAEMNNGGNAIKAGLRKGDVIVQISGTFDELVNVAGLGIDKIRSLVGGRSDECPLVIRVARGSDVMERHQLALVELCITGDDATTAECIDTIYSADNDVYLAGDDQMAICDEDDGTECMLDSMWNDWSFEGEKEEEKIEVVKEEKKKVAQPWASRSSPSGTWVRDPKTGILANIDE